MATVTLNFEDQMKNDLENMVSEMGMNIDTFFMVYVVKALRDRKIPFEIEAPEDPFFSETNMQHLRKSIAQLNAGKGTVRELIEVN